MEPIHDPKRYNHMERMFKSPQRPVEPIHYENMGLRGVRIATTEISNVDGETGELIYRGYHIEDLAQDSSYEEVCYLLVYGDMPNENQLKEFSSRLISLRKLPDRVLEFLETIPADAFPMMALQSAVAYLGCVDEEVEVGTKEANIRKGLRIIARMPTLIAAWHRMRSGLEPLPPSDQLSHAGDFLRMLTGRIPDPETEEIFDKALILHAEHSFNASTFTARVVASTRSNMYASISAAIGSLAGELHGGANVKVMKSLLEIGDPENVEEWVRRKLDRGERIMGMGHAIYRTMDPRATILREICRKVTKDTAYHKWYQITERLEEVAQRELLSRKGRMVYPNVDLYSASLYYSMGIPMDLFTAVFAMARSAGWVAHILEEKFPAPPIKPVLYRPSATYIGRYVGAKEKRYVPIEERETEEERGVST